MNWQTKKLGEVLKLEYGKPLPKSARILNGKYPVYGANGVKSLSDIFYVDRPSIVVGRKGSAGEINLTGGKFWPLDVTYFATFDESKYDLKFLYRLLLTLELSKLAKGVKPGINRNDVYAMEVKIPDLKEQKRIVKILDEGFERIEEAKKNTDQNLKNSKELFESYLNDIFAHPGEEWEENFLKDITTKIGSGATPRGGKGAYVNEGISLIRSMNVYDRFFKEKNLAFIDDKQAKDLSNVVVRENDVLLNITGASVTRSCVIPKEYLPARVNQHVAIIRVKSNVMDAEFLNFLLTSVFYKRQLLLTGEQGLTRQAITKLQLENFFIKYPKSISEQKNIVLKLGILSSEIKKLEAIYKQKLTDLEELKKSVLQKAFAGEL